MPLSASINLQHPPMLETVRVTVMDTRLQVTVEVDPPLGWRFWTFGGFPRDPIEPRPYGGSRGIPLTMIGTEYGDLWLTAMELDGSAQLFTPHELFPCPHQEGAAEFGRAWITRHAVQPRLI